MAAATSGNGASPHIPSAASEAHSLLSRPFRRALAGISNFTPLEFGVFLKRPAVTETTTSRVTNPPEPPAAAPREPTVTPPDPDAPPAIAEVAKWTESDITHPEFDAPARPSGPAKLTGKLKGYASKAQWRKFWADPSLRKYAHRKAEATPGGKKVRYDVLPERRRPPGLGALR